MDIGAGLELVIKKGTATLTHDQCVTVVPAPVYGEGEKLRTDRFFECAGGHHRGWIRGGKWYEVERSVTETADEREAAPSTDGPGRG